MIYIVKTYKVKNDFCYIDMIIEELLAFIKKINNK